MAKRAVNNVKLGVFVLSGLLFLVVLLFLIGRNKNMFGSTYVLKARFSNVQGLVEGNNVRFAGIQVGTVKRIAILSDTVVEVAMHINTNMKEVIKSDAMVSIGTDGIVGNKVVNIVSGSGGAAPAAPESVLRARESVSAEDMLNTLSKSNYDLAIITDELKTTIQRINNSKALWDVLNSESLYPDITSSLHNIRNSAAGLERLIVQLNAVAQQVKSGEGTVGRLIYDTTIAGNLEESSRQLKDVAASADEMVKHLDKVIAGIDEKINTGEGPVNKLLSDRKMSEEIRLSLENVEQGTRRFNESMEALQHNFLLRGYFRKQERKKQRAARDSAAN